VARRKRAISRVYRFSLLPGDPRRSAKRRLQRSPNLSKKCPCWASTASQVHGKAVEWNPGVVNAIGAGGLTQFLVRTWTHQAKLKGSYAFNRESDVYRLIENYENVPRGVWLGLLALLRVAMVIPASRTTAPPHSTVTDFARFLGLSTSVPRAHAV
jgi:hypothetical protein